MSHIHRYRKQATTKPYYRKVIDTFGSDLIRYWPLWDKSGTAAVDLSAYRSNGTHGTGVTPGVTGIGDGNTATQYTGAHNGTDIYSAGLNTLLNKSEGTLMVWAKVSASSVWTDISTQRRLITLRVDSGNMFYIGHPQTAVEMDGYRACGGSSRYVTGTLNSTDWNCYIFTWSVTANECWLYINGIPSTLNPLTPVGAWAGDLASSATRIGSEFSGTRIWSGDIAHVAIATRALTWIEAIGLSLVNPAPLTTLPQYFRLAAPSPVEDFETIGDWTATAGSVADNITQFKTGSHSVKLTTPSGGTGLANKTISWTCPDLDGCFSLWFYCHNAAVSDYTKIGMRISSGSAMTSYYECVSGTAGTQGFRGTAYPGWNLVRFNIHDFVMTGTENWANTMIRLIITATGASGKTAVVSFDDLEFGEKTISTAMIDHDDGHTSTLNAQGYAATKGIRGTVLDVPSLAGVGEYQTVSDLQTFVNKGWSIGNHTYTHPNLTLLTEAQQEAEFLNASNQLIAWGFSAVASKQCGYPSGYWNADSVTALINTGMLSCRYGSGCLSRTGYIPWGEPWHLEMQNGNDETGAAEMLALRVAVRGGSVIYFGNDRIDVATFPSYAFWCSLVDHLYALWKAGLIYPITVEDFYNATQGAITIPAPV